MFKTIANAWKVVDLRKKMLFTIFIVFIFRLGSAIPVPFLDVESLRTLTAGWNDSNNMLSYVDMFSGGAFSNATLFAMSVTPYINSSIIMQLLTVAIPPLERKKKDRNNNTLCDCYYWYHTRYSLLYLSSKVTGTD